MGFQKMRKESILFYGQYMISEFPLFICLTDFDYVTLRKGKATKLPFSPILKIYYLFERQSYREGVETDLPSAGSLPKLASAEPI